MTEQGRSLFGFKPDARIDFAATIDRVHPEDRAARESAIRRALETRGEYEIEYRLLEPDGVVRWINGRARCVEPDDGTGLKLFGVSMDVTARKQAEASAAQEREELQKKRARAGARRTRGHPWRAHRNRCRTKSPSHSPRSSPTPPPESTSSTHPNPTFGRCAPRSPTSARITERAAEVIRRLRDMLKRDTPGFTSLDLNQLIRDVERIVHGDAVAHKVTVELDLSPGVLLGQGRQRSTPAGDAEPDAQRLQRHG